MGSKVKYATAPYDPQMDPVRDVLSRFYAQNATQQRGAYPGQLTMDLSQNPFAQMLFQRVNARNLGVGMGGFPGGLQMNNPTIPLYNYLSMAAQAPPQQAPQEQAGSFPARNTAPQGPKVFSMTAR